MTVVKYEGAVHFLQLSLLLSRSFTVAASAGFGSCFKLIFSKHQPDVHIIGELVSHRVSVRLREKLLRITLEAVADSAASSHIEVGIELVQSYVGQPSDRLIANAAVDRCHPVLDMHLCCEDMLGQLTWA